MEKSKALLSITFVPDPVDFAIVTAFTLDGRKAYQDELEGIEAILEDQKGKSFSDMQEVLRKLVLSKIDILDRSPNDDFDDNPIAPIRQMFSEGFEETDWNSFFYAGMGHSGFFLGVIDCIMDGDKMRVIRRL